ncbi:flagellin [Rhizobium sp. AN80A]|uniref:flagellin N-terminal helical domain-containing protein n=1 Tax=Rhizobium sp. AN80A TaxID=3040673 RepID=UPI000DDA7F7B|nr:flagellin [Rhizobium sp. AN80A]
MSSINSNSSADIALQILRAVASDLTETQRKVSTGFRVERASDNAAYWSIATTMRSDNEALSAVSDALGLGAAMVDTAYAGMSQAIDVMSEIKARFVAATENGVDKTKVNDELSQLKNQLRAIAVSTSFSGQNWLYINSTADNVDRSIAAGIARDTSGAVSVQTMTYDLNSDWDTPDVSFLIDDENGDSGIITNSAFADRLGTASDWVLFNGARHQSHREMELSEDTTNDEIQEMLVVTEAMVSKMTEVASRLGSLSSRIGIQERFIRDLRDSLSSGIGQLVDADMEEESSKLAAKQTQRKLAIQSLSIANSAPGNLLNLFSA